MSHEPAAKRPSAQRLRHTAYHEAGHAVMAHVSGLRTRRVTIIPDEKDGSLGHHLRNAVANFHPDYDSGWRVERIATQLGLCLCGGVVATKVLTGRYDWIGARADMSRIHDLAMRVFGYGEAVPYAWRRLLLERTRSALAQPLLWRSVEGIAAALLEGRKLRGSEVRHIIAEAHAPTAENRAFLERCLTSVR